MMCSPTRRDRRAGSMHSLAWEVLFLVAHPVDGDGGRQCEWMRNGGKVYLKGWMSLFIPAVGWLHRAGDH